MAVKKNNIPGFFRFKKLKNKYLLTNDVGDFVFLPEKEFKNFTEGKAGEEKKFQELDGKNFFRTDAPSQRLIGKYRSRNFFLNERGPSLHIIVVTLRCNHQCLYCQTSSRGPEEKGFDMSLETAKKTVDLIFSSPNPNIAIEFQGGEPLINWPAVKFIAEYALQKNKKARKNLQLKLVSNFTLMDKEKMKFLFDKGVSFCTSLDGPRHIHNKNRIFLGRDNSYEKATYWIKKIYQEYNSRKRKGKNVFKPQALITLTRHSFAYPKEIVDEYLKWKFESIYLAQANFLGMAQSTWSRIGFQPAEYLKFYRKAVDYMIKLNMRGIYFRESGASIKLIKILTDQDPNFFENRSPCGAGLGQMLYNYDGAIYPCDEGRMVAGEHFRIGQAGKSKYREIINHSTVKTLCLTSCLENTVCDICAYKPYCGVCPVLNFALYGNPFCQTPDNVNCKINQGIFNYLFERLENKKIAEIFKSWAVRRTP